MTSKNKARKFRNLPKKKKKRSYPPVWEYLTKTKVPLPKWLDNPAKLITSSALTGSLLLAPGLTAYSKQLGAEPERDPLPIVHFTSGQPGSALSQQLSSILPGSVRKLSPNEEKRLSLAIEANLKIKAAAELDGQRLRTSFGLIGAEQHLRRFPGDSARQHDAFVEAGLAARNGAWGLFAPSQAALGPELVQKEKYYFAVQTFLAPGWSKNSLKVKDWFKYRKVIAVNPKTGQAVVGVVADAGPATWTGKQFGGSPEVMDALGFAKMRYGRVILFFVDDPKDQVPLGPVKLPA